MSNEQQTPKIVTDTQMREIEGLIQAGELYDENILLDIVEDLIATVREQQRRINLVYTERNRVVALAARMAERDGFDAGVFDHEGEAEPGWSTVVAIDLPTGQVSWHLPDAEAAAFTTGLPEYPGSWDGHTTDEKHARIEAFLKDQS